MSRGERLPAHTLLLARWLAGALRGGAPGWEGRRARVEYGPLRLDPRSVGAYLHATAGDDLTFLGQGVVPPGYAALWETAAALELLRRAGAPSPRRGLVHLESERLVLRPLALDATPRFSAEIERVEPHPRGRRITLRSRLLGRGERVSAESRFVLLLRGEGGGAPGGERAERGATEPEWRTLTGWSLPASQGRRYARASGDFNPVHLWGWSARPFGYAAPILHGACLEGMVGHALLRELPGGAAAPLRRFAIRFRAPVLLPAAVRLEVAAGAVGRFRVCGEEDGRVLAAGEWTGGPPRTPALPERPRRPYAGS